MKLIDVLGLKNFRIFDDQDGFFAELSSINILTGANNSGKSSIVKALQMLKNSVNGSRYPFNLDLNQQEHLLGDFENILFNKNNKNVEVTLPFLFFGIGNLCITLSFTIPDSKNTYEAKLRSVEVFDKIDKNILFSFHYRKATTDEVEAYEKDYNEQLEIYQKKNEELSKKPGDIFSIDQIYNIAPSDNPPVGYVDWYINRKKLKFYLDYLRKFYEIYLDNKKNWDEDHLETIDQKAEDKKFFFIPTAVLNLFKNDLDIDKWKDFLENKIGDDEESKGKAHVGEQDFQAEDFYPTPEIQHALYQSMFDVLRQNLFWEDTIDASTNSVIGYCFKSSWDILIQRIIAINYISNIKEENARGYNATSNSPFINLLKQYLSANVDTEFIQAYLEEFEIGQELLIDYQPKYQLILVSIITMDGTRRELVDFGYGIKQIILILIQVSVLAKQNKRIEQWYNYNEDEPYPYYEPSLLIVEEPESNLHPKWQSKLADMLAEASKRFNIQLIIETHSEYLIRKFQTLVAKKEVLSQDIKIFYLRSLQKITEDKKQVESLHIQEDGSIDFNIFDDGFFDVNYKLEFSLLNIQFFKDFEGLKNSKQENEDKIVALEQKIDDFTKKADVTVYQQLITQRFNVVKLLPSTFDYLVSGTFLLENNIALGDFSPVIIQYGRAIENELKQIFHIVNPAKNWMLANMQAPIEKILTGTTALTRALGFSTNAEKNSLNTELSNTFLNPANLRIDLLDDLREIRNSAGHPGHMKTKEQAINYIRNANDFLDKWIAEKK
ncbi:AAA family ATPase [Pedobacter sp. PLR]|uniref:AAA family ATPase n=1 Tax=Pedobacter sp. PLR TaxID=2994465 RepID=UPI002245E39E|nr:AAA family ATPase [Pedobacter sp. PLR]MCX2450076.1 AAA family ATPase [Pedobacter sp. PLR]